MDHFKNGPLNLARLYLARRAGSFTFGLAAVVLARLKEAAFLGARLTRKATSRLTDVAADQPTHTGGGTRPMQEA